MKDSFMFLPVYRCILYVNKPVFSAYIIGTEVFEHETICSIMLQVSHVIESTEVLKDT